MSLRIENGTIVGTSGGKYQRRDPISRYLIGRFDKCVAELATMANSCVILEVGAGEGHTTKVLLKSTEAQIHATDLSATLLAETERILASDRVTYQPLDISDPPQLDFQPDLVVCCEVLEHLAAPTSALKALKGFGAAFYLFSVPREPLFRVMNMARGGYLRDFGNSPGHIQHWSKRHFLSLIRGEFHVIATRSPIPWTMALCSPR